jgi:hypothetical protein
MEFVVDAVFPVLKSVSAMYVPLAAVLPASICTTALNALADASFETALVATGFVAETV